MPYARTDDRVKIYYEEHGPTETASARPPLVLAYGVVLPFVEALGLSAAADMLFEDAAILLQFFRRGFGESMERHQQGGK